MTREQISDYLRFYRDLGIETIYKPKPTEQLAAAAIPI